MNGDNIKVAEVVVTALEGIGATILVLMPGYLLGIVYSKGLRGPQLSEKAFVAATAVGAAVVHLTMLFWTAPLFERVIADGPQDHILEIAVWSATVLIVVPVALGVFLGFLSDVKSPEWLCTVLKAVGLSSTVRTTEAWNYVFRQGFPAYVRVRLKENRLVLGWYGPGSAASQDASAKDLYLERVYESTDGTFGAPYPRTRGVWISGEEIVAIEFFEPTGGGS